MKTPEEFLMTYSSFDRFKKANPDHLIMMTKAMQDYAEYAVNAQRDLMARHLNTRNVPTPWAEERERKSI
jgi:hypothetical protein